MIIAEKRDHAAMFGGTKGVAMFQRIARAVDARALAVPNAKHAIHILFRIACHFLRANQRGSGQIFIDGGLKSDLVFVQRRLSFHQRLVIGAEGRATIARNKASGIQAVGLVQFGLFKRGCGPTHPCPTKRPARGPYRRATHNQDKQKYRDQAL